ncbi:MAG TPA: hypothetical protein VHL98_14960 [Microvirga sp.]|jgi:hypothetical protein|nr:hypothetical protein [Microvirga sp.]
MLPVRSRLVTLFAFGILALGASSAALAQGYGSRYAAPLDDDDDEDAYEYAAPVPPRPIPDYRPGAVETVVTTTRRVVTTRPAYDDDAFERDVTVRRVIVPPPVRRPPVDVVVTTGTVPPRAYGPRYPVYKSEPVYAPAPAWRHEVVAVRPRIPAPPVIIEERRVETTRRILAPAPLD